MNLEAEPSMPDKHKDFSNWYSTILEKAELIDIRYGVKGTIVYMPNIVEIIDRIYKLFEEELKLRGHRKILFPVFIPEDNLKKESEHVKGFEDQVFWVTHAGGKPIDKKLALRPTSETAFYPLYSLWVKSHKDLPLKLYQSVTVYRYETKATRPMLRGREFLWIEAHDVFKNEKEARRQVLEDTEIFRRVVYEELGIPFIHLKREEFDKFPGAVDTYAFETVLPDGRMLQIGTTHYLGTKFSKVFNIRYLGVDEETRYVHQTCFGIGITRIVAALISVHGDEYGMVLPFSVAPLQVVIIPIFKKEIEDEVEKFASEVEAELKSEGYRVKLDLSDKTPGEKFYKYDMLGCPVRIEVGPREVEREELTIFRRDRRERKTIRRSELKNYIRKLEKDILRNLREKAEEEFKSRMKKSTFKDDFIALTKRGNFIVKAGFCGGEKCAEDLKNKTGYEVRGTAIKEKLVEEKCIWCGKPGKPIYIAKAY